MNTCGNTTFLTQQCAEMFIFKTMEECGNVIFKTWSSVEICIISRTWTNVEI